MITIEPATATTVWYVAKFMRAIDRQELEATSPNMDPHELAKNIMDKAAMVFVAKVDKIPVSCWGMVPLWPGVGYAFAFGTDDWGKALLAMTKHVGGFMVRFLLDNGYHRIEARSLASRDDVGRWLEIFGAEAEAVLRGSGARGEDFILYRWLSDELRQTPQGISGDRHPPGDDQRRPRDHDAGDAAAQRVADLPDNI